MNPIINNIMSDIDMVKNEIYERNLMSQQYVKVITHVEHMVRMKVSIIPVIIMSQLYSDRGVNNESYK